MTNDYLITRILNAVPARSYEMTALLSLLRIEITTAVPMACVSCERRPVLRVNPNFVAAHCRTDEHLFLLVMHELHHVLLGHTRLFPRPTPAHNLAFDAVINAFLIHQFPGRAYRSFFLDLYGDETGAARLLAPPAGRPLESPRLASLHKRLYEDGNTTSDEIFRLLVMTTGTDGDLPLLLGDHADADADDWGTDGPASADFVDSIRSIVEKWPSPADPTRGRSLASELKRSEVPRASAGTLVRRTLERALLGASVRGGRTKTAWGGSAAQTVLLEPRDRRAQVRRGVGLTTLLYDSVVPSKSRSPEAQTHVYLDVSGSMDPYIAHLYSGLSSLRRHIARQVHLFSTAVASVPLEALCRGEVVTTGGTDVRCVIDHALAHRVKKALIVTDGYVGAPSDEQLRQLRNAAIELRVVLTPGGWRNDVAPFAVRLDELPRL
jgi:hypothetical protein